MLKNKSDHTKVDHLYCCTDSVFALCMVFPFMLQCLNKLLHIFYIFEEHIKKMRGGSRLVYFTLIEKCKITQNIIHIQR